LKTVAGSVKITVGIEFDTKNSIRKYQICKPVAPQKTSTETLLLRFFRFIQVPVGLVDPIGFILFVKNRKFLCKFAIFLFGG
jgi:hypothetical protein